MPIKKLLHHPLTFLIALCLGIGIYKIAVLACVSNDSVTFMQFAQGLKTSPGSTIKSCDQHPGYPAIICASEWVLGKLGYNQTLGQRIITAQAATLVCRTITICFLYSIFRFFGNKKAALVSTTLVMLIPAYANNGSEVLSDWPNLMLMAMALFFCLRGLRNTNHLCFLTAGLASGLAYWIRPEGAVFVAVLGLYTLFHTVGNSANRLKLWACLGAMIIAAGLIAGPYMHYKGALFPKKKVGTFSRVNGTQASCLRLCGDDGLGRPACDRSTPTVLQHGSEACVPLKNTFLRERLPIKNISQHPIQAGIPGFSIAARPVKAILHFVEKLFNTIFGLSIPLLGILLYKIKRFRCLRNQDQFLILFTSLWLGLMIWLHCQHGYMSHRHIMPLVVFGFAWILKGLHGLVLVFGCQRCNLHRNTAVVLGICIAIFVPKLIRPAHADKAVYKQAGLWLRDHTPADSVLAVFDGRVGFYAERAYQPLSRTATLNQKYVIVKAADESAALPETAFLVTTGQANIDKVIRIYAVDTKKSHE
ncbi:MAG: glycosyltransferase family 39 protein [Planctomycetes bacterium]|nr:glycosyltransferase family 39 protein [Planctomycetota bacterium]